VNTPVKPQGRRTAGYAVLPPEQAVEVLITGYALAQPLALNMRYEPTSVTEAAYGGASPMDRAFSSGEVSTVVLAAVRGEGVCRPPALQKAIDWFHLRLPGLLRQMHATARAGAYEYMRETSTAAAARQVSKVLPFDALAHRPDFQALVCFAQSTGSMFHDWLVANNVPPALESPQVRAELMKLAVEQARRTAVSVEHDVFAELLDSEIVWPRPEDETQVWLYPGQTEEGLLLETRGQRRKVPDLRLFGVFDGLMAGVVWHAIDTLAPHVGAQAYARGVGAPGRVAAELSGFQLVWLEELRAVLYEGSIQGLCLRWPRNARDYMKDGPVLSLRDAEGRVQATVALRTRFREPQWQVYDEKASQNRTVRDPHVRAALDQIYGHLGLETGVPRPPGYSTPDEAGVRWNWPVANVAFRGNPPVAQGSLSLAELQASGWLRTAPRKVVDAWLVALPSSWEADQLLAQLGQKRRVRLSMRTGVRHSLSVLHQTSAGLFTLKAARISPPDVRVAWAPQLRAKWASAASFLDVSQVEEGRETAVRIGRLDYSSWRDGPFGAIGNGHLLFNPPRASSSRRGSLTWDDQTGSISTRLVLRGLPVDLRLQNISLWLSLGVVANDLAPSVSADLIVKLRIPPEQHPSAWFVRHQRQLDTLCLSWAYNMLMDFNRAFWYMAEPTITAHLRSEIAWRAKSAKERFSSLSANLKSLDKPLRWGRRALLSEDVGAAMDQRAVWFLSR